MIVMNITGTPKVRIGGNSYIKTEDIVVYKGEPLLKLRPHPRNKTKLMASLMIYDSAGKEVDIAAHQIDFSEGFLVVERATGRTVCDIKKGLDGVPLADDPDGSLITELDVSVELYTPDGFLFKATPEQTNLSGPVTSGETYIGRDAAIIIA